MLERVRRCWPHVRGLLLALAFALGGIDGCPIPPKGKERKWQKPYTEAIRPVQQTLLSPFKWVTRWGRFHQRWALFQAVGRKQWRMEVSGRTADGQWHVIYRAGDPRYQAYWELLEYRKLRAAWNPTDAMSGYSKFAGWFMTKVLTERPELAGVRIRMEEVRLDRGTVTDTGEFKHVQTRERTSLRPATRPGTLDVPRRLPPGALAPRAGSAAGSAASGAGANGGSSGAAGAGSGEAAGSAGERSDPVKSTKGAPAGVTP